MTFIVINVGFSNACFSKSNLSVNSTRDPAAGESFCAFFPKNTSKPLPCKLIFTTRSFQAIFLITLAIWSGNSQKSPRPSHFRSGSNLDRNPPGFGWNLSRKSLFPSWEPLDLAVYLCSPIVAKRFSFQNSKTSLASSGSFRPLYSANFALIINCCLLRVRI